MLLLLITMAQAKPLSSAEFEDTGHTLAPGQKQIDVFRASQFAISDALELNTVILGAVGRDTRSGWLAGPNAGLEYAIQEGKQGALSVGVSLASDWQFTGQTLGGNLTWTKGGAVKNRFNLSGGASVTTFKVENVDRVNAVGTNLYASYHIVPSKKTTWRIYGGLDPLNTVRSETFQGSLGFDWNHGFGEAARVSLGLALQTPTRLIAIIEGADGDSSWLPAVFPVPTADLFFTW
ncbi:MAG: hypothetical protein ACI9VR_003779 [Cognaticolwellia sp.]|jgi:hypothetical protein